MDFERDGGNTIISKIQVNIQQLYQQVEQLEQQIGRLTFSSESGEKNRDHFNQLAHNAQQLSKETNQLMRQLVDMSNNQKSLKIHRERLQNEYIAVLNRLQSAQKKAANTEKASMNQVRQAAAEQDAANMGRDAEDRYKQQQIQKQQSINLHEMKERTQALQQLEQDIGDVNQIFADLARIVHDQGDIVDSIEANVEHANIHVEQGATNVQQAVMYNQKARTKKMMLCIFLLILLLIVGLTIYFAK